MYTVFVVIQVVLAVSLIGLILIQHGKGADAGAAFGSGASGTVFGSRGAATFLSRGTAVLATLFFITSLVLAVMVARGTGARQSLVESVPAPVSAPAVSAPAEENAAPELPSE